MPPKKDKEIVFFLTNVGKQPSDGDADYFQKAREVMKLIAEKKIFLRPSDEVGIMLMGQKNYNPDFDEKCSTLMQKPEVPTWEHIQSILQLKSTDKSFRHWPEALVEAVQYLAELESASRIILILLFDCEPSCAGMEYSDLAAIAQLIVEQEIQLLWIGSKALKDMSSEDYNKSERYLMQIVTQANGEYMEMEKTLPSLRTFKKHKTRFIAWRCTLDIGSIAIPTATYVNAVNALDTPTFQTINSTDGNVVSGNVHKPEKDYVDRFREAHPVSDTIPGYMYGRKFVPVTEADEAGMNYGSDETKSLELIGFVNKKSIKLEELGGDSNRIIVPDGTDAEEPFYCLIQSMIDTESVGVVRRVYQANSAPKMDVLIPCIDVPGRPACFVIIDLVYEEDRRIDQFESLQSMIDDLTKEKSDAVGDWIDSMMLTDKDDKGNEIFAAGTVPSPGLQYIWNSLSHRALNPNDPLPPMDQSLKKLYQIPESVKRKSEPTLENVKKLFPIKIPDDTLLVPDKTNSQVPAAVPKEMENIVEAGTNDVIFESEKTKFELDEMFDGDMDM